MFTRKQFTFYRSFYNAAKALQPKQRLMFLESIIGYALDGVQPMELKGTVDALFLTIKPTLDTARKKAQAGAFGGSASKALDEHRYDDFVRELMNG